MSTILRNLEMAQEGEGMMLVLAYALSVVVFMLMIACYAVAVFLYGIAMILVVPIASILCLIGGRSHD